MTTSQFEKIYLRPRTALQRDSVAHVLASLDTTQSHAAPATWFVSHTWSNPFADTLEAILDFFDGREAAQDQFLWIDVFVDSQHEVSASCAGKSPAWYMSTFKSTISSIGNLLLIVDTWDNPTALTRAWCVLMQPRPLWSRSPQGLPMLQVRSGAAGHRGQERTREGGQLCRGHDQARAS
jgi:hypothetical protein